jgi:hypothetical protein
LPAYASFVLLTYAVTLFVSASLMFLVEPMIGKMILPLLGGTPAVWNTCMFFYQLGLLAGYTYAHAATRWFDVRKQAVAQVILLLLPFLVLPLNVTEDMAPPGDANQVLGVLRVLVITVGLPFLVMSTCAPLLQTWFAGTGHPSAKDPYFLYSASNLGSMLGLLSYPFLVEPSLGLAPKTLLSQSGLWMMGYAILVVLVGVSAIILWKAPQPAEAEAESKAETKKPAGGGHHIRERGQRFPAKGKPAPAPAEPAVLDAPPTLWQRLRWVALAFVPSSFMLGVTTHITTDVAAIPLLWMPPLALYLLSFIIVFAKTPAEVHKTVLFLMPLGVLVLIWFQLSGGFSNRNIALAIAWDLGVLFLVSMACHGELANGRPSTRYLTEFYLLMSVGGVLGGMFNALVAPLVFNSLAEYQLALMLACLLLPPEDSQGTKQDLWLAGLWWRARGQGTGNPGDARPSLIRLGFDLAVPICAFLLGLALFSGLFGLSLDFSPLQQLFGAGSPKVRRTLGTVEARVNDILKYGPPLVLAYVFVHRPVRFGLAVGAVLAAGALIVSWRSNTIYQTRSFFGVLKVDLEAETRQGYPVYHKLHHGTTLHGMERVVTDPLTLASVSCPLVGCPALETGAPFCEIARYMAWYDLRSEPLTYYHRTGPVGHMFEKFLKNKPKDLILTDADGKPENPALNRVAVIGLGTGTTASYAKPGDYLTYYEIDKAVRAIAENPEFFNYLTDARKRNVNLDIKMGDARVEMKRVKDDKYHVILIDAFSSDAIPVHLMTREAIRDVYLPRLAPGGLMAFHISNRHLDLEPVLANLAKDLRLKGIIMHDEDEESPGKSRSTWVLLTPSRDADAASANLPPEEQDTSSSWERYFGMRPGSEVPKEQQDDFDIKQKRFHDTVVRKYFGDLAADVKTHPEKEAKGNWQPLWWDEKPNVGVWTDDYSNLLSVFRSLHFWK